MKTKILIGLIVLISLVAGSFFVFKNIFLPKKVEDVGEKEEMQETSTTTEERVVGGEGEEEEPEEKTIPLAYQLNIPRVYTGIAIEGEEAPGLCYLGAFGMLALFDDSSLDFADIVAYSGVGTKAQNSPFVGLSNDLKENSIITAANNLGYNFVLGILSGGQHSSGRPEYSFKNSAKEVEYFNNESEAFGYLKNIISLGKPVLVHLDAYYVRDEFAKFSPFWKTAWQKKHASHFMVVTGFNNNYVYINDPTEPDLSKKNMPVPINNFLEAWKNGANSAIQGARVGPYWMIYLKDKSYRKSVGEIIAWNKNISVNSASEIRETQNYDMPGELAVSRLEFAKFLERNGYLTAANFYKEVSNLYLEEPNINFSLIADKEERGRNSL